jgi:hypothetical protein
MNTLENGAAYIGYLKRNRVAAALGQREFHMISQLNSHQLSGISIWS